MKKNQSLLFLVALLCMGLLVNCSEDEDPTPSDDNEEEEVISQVILTFTPDNGEEAITATWFDADGEGEGNPTIDEIELEEEVTYVMTMTLANTLGTEDEDITAEIDEEADDHMFFFSFTDGAFSDPDGDGNVDNRADTVNYNDQDSNGLPIGLSTTWTTEHLEDEGTFTVVLKHQPDGLKTASSDVNIGSTDVNITFPLHIEEGDHGHDEEEEVINEIILTFAESGSADTVSVKWFDADGEGVANPSIEDISLKAGTVYEMTISLNNTLGETVEEITAEIQEEGAEHQFFFGFTADIFSDPSGDGNIDTGSDPLNYSDEDSNGLPIGLSTSWTTGSATSSAGIFRVMLKHQPDLKTSTSDSSVGGTDVDIEFNISIE